MMQKLSSERAIGVSSYRDLPFQSEEMKSLLSLDNSEIETMKQVVGVKYNSAQIFPNWMLNDSEWKNTSAKNTDTTLSDILKTAPHQRTQEQVSTVIHWLMGVWEIANTMGFKRCGMMLQVFKYFEYLPGDNIVVEGERGLTFYIIISGETSVHKEGIGIVANLGKGKSFGEIALTQGKDLRTATIKALTKVEVLHLNKVDYDVFVKDIQQAERRENFHVLRECPLFKEWTRAKVERMANACNRKVVNAGQTIFKQGDEPDNLYLVFEGSVRIIKNVHIVNKNRWPTGPHEWAELSKRVTKPFLIQTLQKGGYFGELSIMKQQTRSTTAEAEKRCTLIALDKLEFLHLLNHSKPLDVSEEIVKDNAQDQALLEQQMGIMKGGPSSVIMMGPNNAANETVKKIPLKAKTYTNDKTRAAAVKYSLFREHCKHMEVAEARMNKIAQEKLERSANKYATLFDKKPMEKKGLFVNMAMASGAGVGVKATSIIAEEAPPKRERMRSADFDAVPAAPQPPVFVVPPIASARTLLNKVKMLNNADYTVRDRVDILLGGTMKPFTSPSKMPNDATTLLDQLDENQIEDIQVVDDSGNMYANIMTENRINLHDLRNVWAYNNMRDSKGNRSVMQKKLFFNPYEKPEVLPLKIKPLMYDMEFNNYYHSRSQVQLPETYPQSVRVAIPVPEEELEPERVRQVSISAMNGLADLIGGISNVDLDVYLMNNQKAKMNASSGSMNSNNSSRDNSKSPKSRKKLARALPANPYKKPVYTDEEQAAEEELNDNSSSSSSSSGNEESVHSKHSLNRGKLSRAASKLRKSKSSKFDNEEENDIWIPSPNPHYVPVGNNGTGASASASKIPHASIKDLSKLRDKLQSKGKLTYSQVMGIPKA